MLRRSVRAPLPVPAISLPALPETRREAQAMAQALRAAMDTAVLAGPAATRRSVLQRSASGDLARRSVVLFATHGLAPFQVPALDQPALAMALDPADPARSLLTLTDVLGLRLNADWVILSACSTASADRVGGDPLSGLSRGFFFAGVSALLVTHWEVETDSAAEITTRTVQAYAASATLSRAQALQQASLALIDAKGTAGLWSHPAYWAPYALVGDGRRRSHRP
jgi:CHAT domain-containing protein